MGSFKIPAISDEDAISLYEKGFSQGWISLKARMPTYWIAAVLKKHGIPIRNQSQALLCTTKSRAESQAMREGRIREYAPGTTGRRRA